MLRHFSIRRNEILDKSKESGLAKIVTTVQIIFFVLSLCARKARGLSISQLEILTLAFAVLAVATYIVLWDKPKDIQVPALICLDQLLDTVEDSRKVAKIIGRSKKSRDTLGSFHQSRGFDLDRLTLLSTFTAHSSKILGFFLFKMPYDTGWFLFFSSPMLLNARLHLLAWDFPIPSTAECIIWRTAAIMTLCIPVPLLGFGFLAKRQMNKIMKLGIRWVFASATNRMFSREERNKKVA